MPAGAGAADDGADALARDPDLDPDDADAWLQRRAMTAMPEIRPRPPMPRRSLSNGKVRSALIGRTTGLKRAGDLQRIELEQKCPGEPRPVLDR